MMTMNFYINEHCIASNFTKTADGLSTSLGEQTGDGLMQCRQTLSDSVWYLAYIYGIYIFMSIIVTIGGCMYHSCCRG